MVELWPRGCKCVGKKRGKAAKLYLGLTCAGPAHLARPSRLALPVVVLLAPEGRGARGRRPFARGFNPRQRG